VPVRGIFNSINELPTINFAGEVKKLYIKLKPHLHASVATLHDVTIKLRKHSDCYYKNYEGYCF
jgi:hypothetical protein